MPSGSDAAPSGPTTPTGPVIVAEQLPESNPIRKISMEYRAAYQKANGAQPTETVRALLKKAEVL